MEKPLVYAPLLVMIVGILLFASSATAVTPSDHGLHEGDLISAAHSDDPDIYIVNEHGYKRLFLNPIIFNFYGHLGGFARVMTVASPTRDAFQTSTLFRNCESNDPQVYAVEVTGEDVGILHPVKIDGFVVTQQDPNFFKKVFCINNNEATWYPKSSVAYTHVSQIPAYTRQPAPTATPSPTLTPTPTPGPGGGSGPTPSPTPSPTETPGPQVKNITMQDFNFLPGTVNVNPGDIVRFTNLDSFTHSAVADGGAWSTPTLSQGQSYDLDTATLSVGTYRYHCGVHGPSMVGTIRINP